MTTAPADGAGPSSETVPVTSWPPATEVGLSLTEESTGGRIVSVAVFVTAPSLADTVPVWAAFTMTDVMTKVLLISPAGIVTLGGTVVAAMLSLKVTTAPPAGAPT